MRNLLGSSGGWNSNQNDADRSHIYRYITPYVMLCTFGACTYMVFLGRRESKINELTETSTNLASFSLENCKLCIEARRQQSSTH